MTQRLCAHEGFGQLLLGSHSGWVDELVTVYGARGGMRQRAGEAEGR